MDQLEELLDLRQSSNLCSGWWMGC